jgi:signal transduction histidine kinase
VLARLLAQNTDGNLSAKHVEYATIIHSSGSDLLQLINDILDLTKVESGKMGIHPERFPLAVLIEDLRSVFTPLTADKQLRFTITQGPGVPART